jgi:hypothetical protein
MNMCRRGKEWKNGFPMRTSTSEGRARGWSVAQCGTGKGAQTELERTTGYNAPVGVWRFKKVY